VKHMGRKVCSLGPDTGACAVTINGTSRDKQHSEQLMQMACYFACAEEAWKETYTQPGTSGCSGRKPWFLAWET
jgi:hypothetical protein